MHQNILDNWLIIMCTENDIDEEALCMLVDNFEEFNHLVPKSGIRMKIKFIIQQLCQRFHESYAPVPSQVLLYIRFGVKYMSICIWSYTIFEYLCFNLYFKVLKQD